MANKTMPKTLRNLRDAFETATGRANAISDEWGLPVSREERALRQQAAEAARRSYLDAYTAWKAAA